MFVFDCSKKPASVAEEAPVRKRTKPCKPGKKTESESGVAYKSKSQPLWKAAAEGSSKFTKHGLFGSDSEESEAERESETETAVKNLVKQFPVSEFFKISYFDTAILI